MSATRFLLLLVLCGCSRPAHLRARDFEARLNSSVGKDLSDLISVLGPPSEVMDLPNGNRLYEWRRSLGVQGESGTSAGGVYGVGWAHGSSSYSEKTCNLRYTVDGNNRVVAAHYGGNSCY